MGTMKSINRLKKWYGHSISITYGMLSVYKQIAYDILPERKGEYAYGAPFVFSNIKKRNGGEYPVAFRDLYKARDHILRSRDSGYTRNEILCEYDFYAEKEQKECIEKYGIDFHGLRDIGDNDIFAMYVVKPKKMENGSFSIGRPSSNIACADLEFDILIPSPEIVEDYFKKEHDEDMSGRKSPYMSTHSGDRCPICHRFTARGTRVENISDASESRSYIIPETPAKYIQACGDCLDFFIELIDSGRYWCFECGKVESFSDRAKCSYSKMIKKQRSKVEKIKEKQRIEAEKQEKIDKISNEWGI